MNDSAPAEAAVRRSYDAVAPIYARSMPDTGREHALDLAMLDTFLELVGPHLVLDAGCGSGRISRYLADRGGRVEGVDLSPEMIVQGRAQHPDLDLSVASVTDLPHDDAAFGGVVLWYSTIHLSPGELGRALDESLRVLVPGGLVLIAFQSGVGTRILFDGFPGGDVALERFLRPGDEVAGELVDRGAVELVRLERSGAETGDDDHTLLLHRSVGGRPEMTSVRSGAGPERRHAGGAVRRRSR